MKTCAYCGRENEDQATKCQECGTDFNVDPAPAEHTPKEPGETERLEKVAVLDNEVQAELIDGVLSGRDIPHIMAHLDLGLALYGLKRFEEAAQAFPGVQHCVTAPLGVHDKIGEVILERAGVPPVTVKAHQ